MLAVAIGASVVMVVGFRTAVDFGVPPEGGGIAVVIDFGDSAFWDGIFGDECAVYSCGGGCVDFVVGAFLSADCRLGDCGRGSSWRDFAGGGDEFYGDCAVVFVELAEKKREGQKERTQTDSNKVKKAKKVQKIQKKHLTRQKRFATSTFWDEALPWF